MDRTKLNQGQLGLSLIEGMIAAAVVGIGFVAVFSLSTFSTNILMSSIDREKARMLTTMIMEDLLTDQSTINSCATTCPYHDMDFKVTNSADTTSAKEQAKWHGQANKLFGAPASADKRLISFEETTAATGVFVVTIEINSRNGRAKNTFKRTINAWAP